MESLVVMACLGCNGNDVQPVVDLGKLPLANSLGDLNQIFQPDEKFPLRLGLCNNCKLVQLLEIVPPEKMFSNYLYFSSFSQTMLNHARGQVDFFCKEYKLNSNSLVVEIASNDGYLLQYFKEKNVPILGIEPATNIAKVANDKGIKTLNRFFNLELAKELTAQGTKADLIIGNNVLAHIPTIQDCLKGTKELLSDNGVVSFEAPYLKDMLDKAEFDTIYHEHVFYFSVTALNNIFNACGLKIFKIIKQDIHGGTIQILASKNSNRPIENVQEYLDMEKSSGLLSPFVFQKFTQKIEALSHNLKDLLQSLHEDGKRVAGYGAAAKATILLNHFGIDSSLISYVVDKSPHKQNKYIPGVKIPIFAPEKLLEDMPEYILIMAWNFADEIMQQQKAYKEKGGKFIVPIPNIHIV